MPTMRAYIGSYSIPSEWTGTPHAHGEGIVAVRLGEDRIEPEFIAASEVNPSFTVADPEASRLWAITEPEFGGELLCFDVDGAGRLSLGEGGRVVTGSDAPCHLELAPDYALVSHYHGASVAVIGRNADGRPGELLQTLVLPGSGADWNRSAERSRPHCALVLPGGDRFVVADCGRHAVSLFLWSSGATGEARTVLLDTVLLSDGSGPRHFALLPREGDRETVLVSLQNSGGAAVVSVTGDGADSRLELRQVLHTEGVGRGQVIPSEIAVHPSGGFAVMANRLDDSLTVFDINEVGELTERESVDSMGRNPRYFSFTPDGSRLVVAHQDSDELTEFSTARGELRFESATPHATPTSVSFW